MLKIKGNPPPFKIKLFQDSINKSNSTIYSNSIVSKEIFELAHQSNSFEILINFHKI